MELKIKPAELQAIRDLYERIPDEKKREIIRMQNQVVRSEKLSGAINEIESILNEDAKQRSKLNRIRNVVKKVKWTTK